MPRKVAVLFVHGIGVSDQDYALEMIGRIKKKLPKSIADITRFNSAFWADIVRPHQRDFFQRAQEYGGLEESTFRRFALEGLGDAAAYQQTPRRMDAPYFKIQKRVREAIEVLDSKGDPQRPLVVIGHSLGCHILSSFNWDANSIKQSCAQDFERYDEQTRAYHGYLTSGSPFRRLDTLAGFVTMGSNMPLFTFTFQRNEVTPITSARPGKIPAFPGSALTPAVRAKAAWKNFYSKNDLLAYPLRPLYDLEPDSRHLNSVLEDIQVRSEGFIQQKFYKSPINAIAAHTGYWTNGTVIRHTADVIRAISEAEDQVKA